MEFQHLEYCLALRRHSVVIAEVIAVIQSFSQTVNQPICQVVTRATAENKAE